MSKVWFLVTACLLLALLGVNSAHANHLLGMTMSWEPAATPNQVRFTITAYLRISALAEDDQDTAVGSYFCEGWGGMHILFGDGGSTPWLCFKILSADHDSDILVATSEGIYHSYVGSGPFYAEARGCCRGNSQILNNRIVDDFRMVTRVTPGDRNRSPVSTSAMPIIRVSEAESGGFRTFPISATDPDHDNITYRLATNTEATGLSGTGHNGAPSESGRPAMAIDPTSGIVTWYNHGLDRTRYYTQQFIAEDHNPDGSVRSQTAIDLLLQICPDTTRPTIAVTLNPNSCSPPTGNLVNVAASINVSDNCDPNPAVVLTSITSNQNDAGLAPCDQPIDVQGATTGTYDTQFQLRCEAFGGPRTYTVTYTATDASGNSATGSATFTVQPATNTPTISLSLTPNSGVATGSHSLLNVSANITVGNLCTSGNSTVKLLSITSDQSDAGLGSGDLANDIQGATLNSDDRSFQLRAEAIGGTRTYTVTYQVTDQCCRTSTGNATFTVTVPPTLRVALNSSGCWPPSHNMIGVTATPSASGGCAPYSYVLQSITVNEPDNSTGDGNTVNDVQNASTGTDDRSFDLRCERQGNNGGRYYTITYQVTDACGATATASAIWSVVHDQGTNKRASESGGTTAQEGTSLSQNRPNPFNGSTTIDFTLDRPGNVVLSVVSPQGEEIRRILSEQMSAGSQSAEWDGLDNYGKPAPGGTYFYWLESSGCNCVLVKSMVLQR